MDKQIPDLLANTANGGALIRWLRVHGLPHFRAAAADWRAAVLLAEPAASCQPILRPACDHTLCAIMNDLHVCELSHSKRADQGLSPTAKTRYQGVGGSFITSHEHLSRPTT